MRHLLQRGPEAAEDRVAEVDAPQVRAASVEMPFEELIPDLLASKVVVLVDEIGQPRGILTTIDGLEYLAGTPAL